MINRIEKKVISKFDNVDGFVNVLKSNPGIFIVKFSADWCKPCKKIKPVVDAVFASTPSDVVCADIDISEDGNKDIYSFLKNRRMINGVPTLFMYKKGNNDLLVPDESISGANASSLHTFFTRCGMHLSNLKTQSTTISV